MWKAFGVACLSILILPATSVAQSNVERNAPTGTAELIRWATETVDLRAAGNPPFRLRARIKLFETGKDAVEGSYELTWASTREWREEIKFPGYEETRLVKENKLWRSRSQDFLPYRVWQLRQTVRLGRIVGMDPEEKIKRVEAARNTTPGWICFERGPRKHPEREFCFDPKTKRLMRYTEQGIFHDSVFELADHAAVGSAVFPRRLKFYDEGEPAYEMWIEELSIGAALNVADIAPPSRADVWEWCERPEPVSGFADPYGAIRDDYALGLQNWRAAVYVKVDADGTVKNLRVVQSSDPRLDNAILKALKKARVKPATCKGKPVPFEMIREYGTRTLD